MFASICFKTGCQFCRDRARKLKQSQRYWQIGDYPSVGRALLANALNDPPPRLSTVLKASENQYYIYVVRLKRRAAPRAGLEGGIPRTARGPGLAKHTQRAMVMYLQSISYTA